jgi:hypothetical protein
MVQFSGWQDGAADSATGYVNNGGGGPFVVSDTAYSVIVTTNTRSGVRDNPTVPADVPDHSFAVFRSDWWDSSGVLMKPQILRITWRDRCDRTLIESCINNVLRQT